MYNRGGQRRTIEATCGWRRAGHPQEVNKLYLLHKKFCNRCQETTYEAPAFNKEAANINGWRGILPSGQQPLHIQSTCLIDGKRVEVISEAHSVEEATRDLSLDPVRDTIIEIASNMKEPAKKKRHKKKAKKVQEINVEDIEEILEQLAETESEIKRGK